MHPTLVKKPSSIIGALIILALLALPQIQSNQSFGLQQISGQLAVQVKPGESKTVQWGLVSDNENGSTVQLHADGDGSSFLSLPKEVFIPAGQVTYVDVKISVPSSHPGGIRLSPALYAAEIGQPASGGGTVINIQMKKIIQLDILPNDNPEIAKLNLAQEFAITYHDITLKGSDQKIQLSLNSSSEISDFAFDEDGKKLSFKVSGVDGTVGTIIMPIGKILEGPYVVLIDGEHTSNFELFNLPDSSAPQSDTTIVVHYSQSQHDVVITGTRVVPEFPLSMVGAMGAVLGIAVFIGRSHLMRNRIY